VTSAGRIMRSAAQATRAAINEAASNAAIDKMRDELAGCVRNYRGTSSSTKDCPASGASAATTFCISPAFAWMYS